MIWESYQVYLYEHSKFFISVTQSCCSLWISTFSSCKSRWRHSKENDKATVDNLCQLKILIPFTDFYKRHVCYYLSLLSFYKWFGAIIDYTYSGTKLLSSYPSFKEPCHGKLCLQVTIMWHALLVSGQPQTHSAWLPVR